MAASAQNDLNWSLGNPIVLFQSPLLVSFAQFTSFTFRVKMAVGPSDANRHCSNGDESLNNANFDAGAAMVPA